MPMCHSVQTKKRLLERLEPLAPVGKLIIFGELILDPRYALNFRVEEPSKERFTQEEWCNISRTIITKNISQRIRLTLDITKSAEVGPKSIHRKRPQTIQVLETCIDSIDCLHLGALGSQKCQTSTKLKDLRRLQAAATAEYPMVVAKYEQTGTETGVIISKSPTS